MIIESLVPLSCLFLYITEGQKVRHRMVTQQRTATGM